MARGPCWFEVRVKCSLASLACRPRIPPPESRAPASRQGSSLSTSATELTNLHGMQPDVARDEEAARQRFPPVASHSPPSVQTPSSLRSHYHGCDRLLVIDLNVQRNQPQSSNVAFQGRASKKLPGSCPSRGGRCQGTHGNSSYIFSAEKSTVSIKYSKVWKWYRTAHAHIFLT